MKTEITIDANGEELKFIKFLQSLLPQKPDVQNVFKTAVEKASTLIPFEVLVICVEYENLVKMFLFKGSGVSDEFLSSTKESITKGKNLVFPKWKEMETDEVLWEFKLLGNEKVCEKYKKFSSVLQYRVDDPPARGLVVIFSGKSNAFEYKHEFLLGILAYWMVSYSLFAETYEKLESLAVIDPLTGIYNRRKFENELQREIERAKRYNLEFSLIMMDVDNLKNVNDTYGHFYGDMVLQKTAKILSSNLRKVDVVTRIGGDEFVIILPHTGSDGAKVVVNRLIGKMKTLGFVDVVENDIRIPISCTFSVTSFTQGDTLEDMYKRIDSMLLEAKKTQKGGVKFME